MNNNSTLLADDRNWQYISSLDIAGGLWFVGIGICLDNLPRDPNKEELEWQAAVRHQLVAERPIAPVPRHVEVRWVHTDEEPDGGESAIAPT